MQLPVLLKGLAQTYHLRIAMSNSVIRKSSGVAERH